MTSRSTTGSGAPGSFFRRFLTAEAAVFLIAAAVYLGGVPSPPGLMDDVDAVQAQIARTMLESGDWVTARLNGVAYLEKSPLIYWLMALSFAVFGVHDWAARLPLALSVVGLCWLTCRFGRWAFGATAGFYAGLALATSAGLWLFTRIQIPDAMLTATVTLAMWSFLRALDGEEPRPRLWAAAMAASIGTGLLLKGLIAAVFPVAAALLFLALTGGWRDRAVWRRLHPVSGAAIALAIATPWHILAMQRNPPLVDFTMRSEPGQYRGFFWFYFLNEHLFRFLDMRHPRDYNTVPRGLFWGFHLLWLFPWSAFLAATARLEYRGASRAARTRLLALCWTGFLLGFFTLSTTQEYYSMPCYPALALLLGSALAEPGRWVTLGRRALAAVFAAAALVLGAIGAMTLGTPAPGDIARAHGQPRVVHPLARAHGGFDAGGVRLPALAGLSRRGGVPAGGGRGLEAEGNPAGAGPGARHGAVLPRRAGSPGALRSLSGLEGAG